MRLDSNRIGQLGEAYFQVAMLNYKLFRPAFLREKWPISDFFVEIEESDERYFFIVQVKATTSKKGSKVSVLVNQDSLQKLASYPAPTYVALVDVNVGDVFLVSAMESENFSPSRLTKIDHDTSLVLRSEVIQFWKGSEISMFKEKFQSQFS